ncbi:putative AC transposase [Sesamum angolense]|uniref:AC transposase n=1 Tax=Sesamum angolense TaxID=2727404 RepID=A0AAE1X2A2_9LAMI|nr:putative AC transposase [Sesamum angolense]
MCLTAHWIDDSWKLQKRILNFVVVENHKGSTIGRVIEECLVEWNIEDILTLTVDNASSNDLAIDYLKRNTKWKRSILDNRFLHVRCCAHIVNLIVKDGLNEQSKCIVRIRNAIKYVRSSSRFRIFKKCVDMEKIESKHLVSLDIDTRWNSTYLMLEHAEKFEWAFKRLEREDNAYALYFDSYDDVEDFVDNGSGEGMAIRMKEKFDKYWSNIKNMNELLFVAMVLDPRYKMKYVSYCLNFMYGDGSSNALSLERNIEHALNDLYYHYLELYDSHTSQVRSDTPSPTIQDYEVDELGDVMKLIKSGFDKHLEQNENVERKSELLQYLSEPHEKRDEAFDILNWWRQTLQEFMTASSSITHDLDD